MPQSISENSDIHEELLRMHQLNVELLEHLELSLFWIDDFSKKHELPIPNREKFSCLIKKASILIEEITKPKMSLTNQKTFIRRNFTSRKSDNNFTESLRIRVKYKVNGDC